MPEAVLRPGLIGMDIGLSLPRIAILLGILLILMVPAVPSDSIRFTAELSPIGERTISPAALSPLAQAPTSNGGPYVAYTFDECSNGLVPGNYLPTDCGGLRPWGVVDDQGKHQILVSNRNATYFDMISDESNYGVGAFYMGNVSAGMVYDGGEQIFVASPNNGRVNIINDQTWTMVASPRVGKDPELAVYDHSVQEVYVTNTGTNNVSGISDSANTIESTIRVGTRPQGIAYDSGEGELFVANSGSNNVSVIADYTDTVVATIRVGSDPQGVAYDSSKGEIFVANNGSNNVSVISDATNTVVASIPVGSGPQSLTYDHNLGELFVTNYYSGNLSVISDALNSVTSTIQIGSMPVSSVYDQSNGYLYVTNSGQGTVSIVYPGMSVCPCRVSFTQSGLASGTSWSVSLNGSEQTSSASTITFTEPNGTYWFTVQTTDRYLVNPGSGTVAVDAVPAIEAIEFTPIPKNEFLVGFNETGLPIETTWSVKLDGALQFSNSSTIAFAEANGTYSCVVEPVVGYRTSACSQNVSVNGVTTWVEVPFTPIPPSSFLVTFTETGLDSLASWTASIDGISHQAPTRSINFTEPNGTYWYVVGSDFEYSTDPSSGIINVSGSPVSIVVPFAPIAIGQYLVTFYSDNLPIGTNWSVTLNGVMHHTVGLQTTFTEPNGSWAFSVGQVHGLAASPSSGSIVISGRGVTQIIAFGKPSTGGTGVSNPLPVGFEILLAFAAVIAAVQTVVLLRRKASSSMVGKEQGPFPSWRPPWHYIGWGFCSLAFALLIFTLSQLDLLGYNTPSTSVDAFFETTVVYPFLIVTTWLWVQALTTWMRYRIIWPESVKRTAVTRRPFKVPSFVLIAAAIALFGLAPIVAVYSWALSIGVQTNRAAEFAVWILPGLLVIAGLLILLIGLLQAITDHVARVESGEVPRLLSLQRRRKSSRYHDLVIVRNASGILSGFTFSLGVYLLFLPPWPVSDFMVPANIAMVVLLIPFLDFVISILFAANCIWANQKLRRLEETS
jgi:YVTN family beta-propeller protein